MNNRDSTTSESKNPKKKSRRLVLATISLALLVAGVQVAAFHDLRHDDAYITYRYGQNLAGGFGLVFNPGERIMGSTSPGQALLAGLVYFAVGQEWLPSIMSALGCFGWTAQALALFFLLRFSAGTYGAAAVAVCIAAGGASSPTWVALEMNLSVGFALWAIYFGLRSRWNRTAALCALAGLMRPDAYLIAALLGLACVRELKRSVWKPGLIFLAFALPWPIFATAYYGTPIPHSAITKFQQVDFFTYLGHIAQYPALLLLPFHPPGWSLPLAWMLVLWGGFFLIKRDRRLWVLPAYCFLHFIAYAFLAPPPGHVWHLYPGNVVFVALAIIGLVAFQLKLGPRPARAFIALAIAALAVGYFIRTVNFAQIHSTLYYLGARDAAYREAATYIVAHADPLDVIATDEVGTVGYFSRHAIHDWGGLITKHPRITLKRVKIIPSFRHIEVTDGPPEYRWIVLSKHSGRSLAPTNIKPVRVFRHGTFSASVFDLASYGFKYSPPR